MKRKLPTILILVVMVLVGAMYWVDLSYYTDPASGLIVRGTVWTRYAIVALPLLMCLLGLRTVGPRSISVFRMKNAGLAGVMMAAAVFGVVFGIAQFLQGLMQKNTYSIILGAFVLWYSVWMVLAGVQLFSQNMPSPTKSAFWGVLAAMPFPMITVYRIMVRPSSLHRVAPMVRAFSALFAMLWFGLLLRSLYIALPRRRVRWMYLAGVFTFLFSTCLELTQALHSTMLGAGTGMELLESLFMGSFGLVAGCISVSIAGQSAPGEDMTDKTIDW